MRQMRPDWPRSLALMLTIGAWTVGSAAAQEATSTTVQPADPSPLSLEKIKAGLLHQPLIVFDAQPTFRSGVSEHRPSYFDLDNQFALPRAAPTWNTGWHNEFLTMVTPPEFRMWQAFTGKELVQVAGM